MKYINRLILALLIGALGMQPVVMAKQVQRERVNLNLQNVKIADFIKMVGKVTGKNILLSQPIPGTINFISSSPIYKDELMSILLAVLGKKGFTIIEHGTYLQVVRANTAVKENLPVGLSDNGLMHTMFIEVKNENVDIIAAKVRQFLSPGGKLLTIKETNTMIISDQPENIKVVKKVLDKIEKQQSENFQVEFIVLKNAKASRLAANILKISKNIINQKIVNNKVSILSDDATNSIILMASSHNIKKLVPLIKRLDAKDDSGAQRLTIISLENSEAKNVVTSLTAILEKKKYTKETDKPLVSVYEELNAIVVSGTESDIEDIQTMVNILDVEKPQVFVRARIIEIVENEAETLGVKYGIAGGAATDAGLFSFAANLGGSSMVIPDGLLDLSGVSYDAGIVFGATIDFLESNGAANRLSEPTLLCVNNQESTIYVGKTEPIVTSTVQGNQSTDLARNTFTREDIGLTLKIKPRLSSGNKVTLIVSVKLEDISNSAIPGLPSTIKREVVTSAIVPNGQSVILGGLISDKERYESQGLPYLRDIPWLGGLFDWESTSHETINLVIMLTPYIVRSDEDISRIHKILSDLDKIQSDYEKLIEQKLEERLHKIDNGVEKGETSVEKHNMDVFNSSLETDSE